MADLSIIINKIKKRPGMFLGSNSITALQHYLNGYYMAMRDFGIQQHQDKLFPLDFWFMNEFVSVCLQCNKYKGWRNNILEFCDGSEERALDEFFDLYDGFQQIKIKRYWRAVLTENNIKYNNSMEHAYHEKPDGKEPVFKNPVAVYVIELSVPAFILAVETKSHVKLERQFFTSEEDAKGNGHFPEGAGIYFGENILWEEVISDSISFGKNTEV